MYIKEELGKFKSDLKTNMQAWAEGKINDLGKTQPRLKTASVYLKRGLNNWLEREDKHINRIVDNLTLFIADEKGQINTDIIIEDLMEMFKGMEVQEMELGMFHVAYGKGEINISIPHNPMLDIIFGNLGHVKITADDLLEMKEMFAQ